MFLQHIFQLLITGNMSAEFSKPWTSAGLVAEALGEKDTHKHVFCHEIFEASLNYQIPLIKVRIRFQEHRPPWQLKK